MKLANQDQVQALDPEFGRMAAEVGFHAWSLPQLTMRESLRVPRRGPVPPRISASRC